MNRLFFLTLCFCIILIPATVYATTTDEVSLFKNFYGMFCNPKEKDNPVIIDYSIEIVKNMPDSLDSMLVFSLLTRMSIDDRINRKYYQLKEKYYNDLDNVDVNVPEKLVLLFLLTTGIDVKTDEDMNNNINKFNSSLIKIKDSCKNKDYAALANILLMFDKEKQDLYIKDFKTNYPNHKCLPSVELIVLSRLYATKEYQKCISECELFIKKYEKIQTPFGWRHVMDSYNLMVFNYLALKDYENAVKYCKMIEVEAPNYDNLKQLKSIIKRYKK